MFKGHQLTEKGEYLELKKKDAEGILFLACSDALIKGGEEEITGSDNCFHASRSLRRSSCTAGIGRTVSNIEGEKTVTCTNLFVFGVFNFSATVALIFNI